MHEYIDVIRDFGPIVGVVLFFIWRDWKREDRLAARVTELEKYQQTVLSELIKQTNIAVTHNTQQLEWVVSLVRGCHNTRGGDE